jgi:hypothetical protein
MSRKLAALVVGNGMYINAGVLKNPAHDAEDMAGKLIACGFDVSLKIDITHQEFDRALNDFKLTLKTQDVGLFFFAGHGVQIDGDNYLAAIDTKIGDEVEAKHSSVSLNFIIETMEKANNSTNIIILDACRDNPWDRAWRRPLSRGLAPVYAPKGTLIAFSTSPGQVAADGNDRNGSYTEALLQHIDAPDCSIETMFKRVRNTLAAITSQRQTSWEHTSLSGEFYFNLSVGARITDYGATAISDKLFVLDENKASHKIIKALKIPTWDRQNSALRTLTFEDANLENSDSLFVLGRNIYQAACGTANNAMYFISSFMDKTQGLLIEKRKAILDGMLFEMFFDPFGRLREYPKLGNFNEVFGLRGFDDLKPSFDFIAECLLPYADRFYVIPGKPHELGIDINVDFTDNNYVKSIFCGGKNILRVEDRDFYPSNYGMSNGQMLYHPINRDKLKKLLSIQMIVPEDLLIITFSPSLRLNDDLVFPKGYTVRHPAYDT